MFKSLYRSFISLFLKNYYKETDLRVIIITSLKNKVYRII
jgi:hypothetical protein